MPLIEGREKGKTAFGQQVVEIMGAEQEPLACKRSLTKERQIFSSPQVQLSYTSSSQGTEEAMHAIHAPHLIVLVAWKDDTDNWPKMVTLSNCFNRGGLPLQAKCLSFHPMPEHMIAEMLKMSVSAELQGREKASCPSKLCHR